MRALLPFIHFQFPVFNFQFSILHAVRSLGLLKGFAGGVVVADAHKG